MKTYKELQEDLQRSIKEGNKQNTQVLRSLLTAYKNEMLSEEVLLAEIQHLVTQCPASGKAIIGFVMKSLKQKYGSSFDGALANRLISQVAGV